MIDTEAIATELQAFISSHDAAFREMSRRHSQVLELGALLFAASHYARNGYVVTPRSLEGALFVVKRTSTGNLRNYSWFECGRGVAAFAVRMNVPVISAYGEDHGVYVVDVGVTDVAPTLIAVDGSPPAVSNTELHAFAEVKALRIYPMGLAHFIGIVHELQPHCLGRRRRYGARRDRHFAPTLFTVGDLTKNSDRIVRSYEARAIRVNVVPAFDRLLSRLTIDAERPSPLRY